MIGGIDHFLWLFLLAVSTVVSVVKSQVFTLDVYVKQQNLDTFEEKFWSISTPGSSDYLKFLSTGAIASVIGAEDETLNAVKAWLKTAGGVDITVSSLHDTVSATFLEPPLLKLGKNGIPHKETHPHGVQFIVRRNPRSGAEKLDFSRLPTHPLSLSAETAKGEEKPDYSMNSIKSAYGIPLDLQATNEATQQMVWGPGTFGYSPLALEKFKLNEKVDINTDKIFFDTDNHGSAGGDNFMEGQLDTNMITAFGLNVTTIVSNTNTSASTEETTGFGAALLDFLVDLAAREVVPQVLSMSLGSLSAASCDLLCEMAVETYGHTSEECSDYMASQRQVCMYLNTEQTERINVALQVLGARGVTVLGSSGDGGSHFSFSPFTPVEGDNGMAEDLNAISCTYQIPVFPTASSYVLSIGGEMWEGDSDHPVTWAERTYGSGGGMSIQFDMPEHQKATVAEYLSKPGMPPSSSYTDGKRAYPDVSALGVQGTSQSAPILGGIFALIIDMRLNAGLPPLGCVAPRIYQVAEKYPNEAFSDIVGGNSGLGCGDETGFPATDGWDCNTGFGRPVWEGMVKYFASDDAE